MNTAAWLRQDLTTFTNCYNQIMPKQTKKTMPRNPKKAMNFLLDHEIKHPQTEVINILKSVDVTSEKAKKNATMMRDSNGREIIYIILKNQKKGNDKGNHS